MINKIITTLLVSNVLTMMYFMYKIGEARFDLWQLRDGSNDADFAKHIAKTGGNSLMMVPFPDIDPVYSDEQAALKRSVNRRVGGFWVSVIMLAVMIISTMHYIPSLWVH